MEDDAKFCNICGASLAEEGSHKQRSNVTGISPEDAQEIIAQVQRLYASIPLIARPMVPSMPQILRGIPVCARKYTLQQIIDLLEEAHVQGLL